MTREVMVIPILACRALQGPPTTGGNHLWWVVLKSLTYCTYNHKNIFASIIFQKTVQFQFILKTLRLHKVQN